MKQKIEKHCRESIKLSWLFEKITKIGKTLAKGKKENSPIPMPGTKEETLLQTLQKCKL